MYSHRIKDKAYPALTSTYLTRYSTVYRWRYSRVTPPYTELVRYIYMYMCYHPITTTSGRPPPALKYGRTK